MTFSRELAEAIESTEPLMARFLAGFSDEHAVTQTPDLPNHVAWTLGHLALTMHRAAERISGDSFELGWDPEPYALGSTPTGRRGDYPPIPELIERYRGALHLLADTVRRIGDDGLTREVTWGRSHTTARDLVVRMVFHNGLHCGQLVDLRRALGFETVIR